MFISDVNDGKASVTPNLVFQKNEKNIEKQNEFLRALVCIFGGPRWETSMWRLILSDSPRSDSPFVTHPHTIHGRYK